MKLKTLALVAMGVLCAHAGRLTYIGASGGSWLAAGAWQNEGGSAVNWTDGETAVIGDKSLTLPSDVTVHGIEWTTTTKRTISGAGKLTIGAGGIIHGGNSEINFQNNAGLHLTADQTWHSTGTGSIANTMICIDGKHNVTAESGVTVSVTGKSQLRWNANASLTSDVTVKIVTPAYISFSPSASFGSPTMILDGDGYRAQFGVYNVATTCTLQNFASVLYLRNGADVEFYNTSGNPTFSVPRVIVDSTQTGSNVSEFRGTGTPMLKAGATEFDVTAGCRMKISVSELKQDAGVTARFTKTGAGELELAIPTANFSGGVDVQAGTLRIGTTGGAGTGPVAIAESATVALPATGAVPNEFSGLGTLAKNSAGVTELTGSAAAMNGTVSISAGTLRATPDAMPSAKVLIGTDGVWAVTGDASYETDVSPKLNGGSSGGVYAAAGSQLTAGTWNASGNTVLDAEKNGTLTIASLTGTGWTKSGEGYVRIGSLAGYSGSTFNVANGVLMLASTDVIPSGCIAQTSGSGIIQFDSTTGFDVTKLGGTKAATFSEGAGLEIDTSSEGGIPPSLAVSEGKTLGVTSLTGANDFYKTGAGTLTLSGAGGFAGRIFVLGGTLRVTGSAGVNEVVVSNGVFSAAGSGTVLQNSFRVEGGVLQAEDGASLGAGALTLKASGTLCVTNGGTFGWSELPVSAGKVRIAQGGVVSATTMNIKSGGALIVSDGTHMTAPVTLSGGTLTFDETTALEAPITQTAATSIYVNSGKTGTFNGFYTNSAGKCKPQGPGHLSFAGGGNFTADNSELFVQGGTASIDKKDFAIKGYFGLEYSGKRLTVNGAKVSSISSSNYRAIHLSSGAGIESVFEVCSNGTVVLDDNFGCKIAYSKAGWGKLRVTTGGTFKYKRGNEFTVASGTGSTGIVEVVGGTLETAAKIVKGGSAGKTTILVENANVKVAYNGVLIDNGMTSAELRGANTLDVESQALTLGQGWKGDGSLSVTGTAGGKLTIANSLPNWTGTLSLANVGLTLNDGVELATDKALFAGTEVSVASGTAVIPFIGGTSAVKKGAGELKMTNVEGDDFEFTVEEGNVKVALPQGLTAAGDPVLWLDASVESSFTKTGTDISKWSDKRSGRTGYAVAERNAPQYNASGFNGKPFVDFGVMADSNKGRAGDNRSLTLNTQLTNVRTVFWMVGSRNGGGFLLGDKTESAAARSFHRGQGPETTYGAVASDPLWHNTNERNGYVRTGTTWINGDEVNGTTTGLSGAWDLVGWRLSEANDSANKTPSVTWLASCYNPGAPGRLNGGQDLAELIIYDKRLTDDEVLATQRYLSYKWMATGDVNKVKFAKLVMRGEGTTFMVADGIPAQIGEVVIEGTGASVCGVEGNSVVFDAVTVKSGGEWDAGKFFGTTAGDITFEENAVVSATIDENGLTSSYVATGAIALPSSLFYKIAAPDKVIVRRASILKGASMTGVAAWKIAQGSSRSATISANAAGAELLLRGQSQLIIYVR